MISISLPLPPTGLRAPGSPLPIAPPGDFALALADMLTVPDSGIEPRAASVDRQIDAGPGKALPVDKGVDAAILNSGATKGGAPARQAAPSVLPAGARSTAPNNTPFDSERSAGEERAHARKEAIATLPLPIPATVPPMAMPASPPTEIAASAANVSRTATSAPVVSSAVIAPSGIAAVLPPDQPLAPDTKPNAEMKERASAPAVSRLARDVPGAASAVASVVADRAADAIGVDPVVAQSNRRPTTAPTSPPAPTAPRTAVDTIAVPVLAATMPADAPMRPTRFQARARQAADTTVPTEQRPSARMETVLAKREPAWADAGAALPPSHSPKPGKAAVGPRSPREGGPSPAFAVRRNAVAAGVAETGPRSTPGMTERAATPPLAAERRLADQDLIGRAGNPEAPRPQQEAIDTNTKPVIDAAARGVFRPKFSKAGQVARAVADGARPEIKAADHSGRPAPAPDVQQAGAAHPHRPAGADTRISAAPAPLVQGGAPAAMHGAAPSAVTPSARMHAEPARLADNAIAPAQAKPIAPASRPAPIVPPAAAPIAAMFGGPRPIEPRAPRAREIVDAPAGLAHTLATPHAASPIQPVAETHRTPLDMRRDDWTQKLIDRIETIRDVANAADTRIKLMPDALGKIDVSMRKDGDTVHVSFAADVPATRAMLADAQPRLADLAQQRGLRLGQASVDTGTGGEGQQRPADPRPVPSRPMRAAVRDAAFTETGRVA